MAHLVPLFMGISRQEYWIGVPFPPPGDFPDPGIEPVALMSPALAGGFFTSSATWEAHQSFPLEKSVFDSSPYQLASTAFFAFELEFP